jgi:hypothetical protein
LPNIGNGAKVPTSPKYCILSHLALLSLSLTFLLYSGTLMLIDFLRTISLISFVEVMPPKD